MITKTFGIIDKNIFEQAGRLICGILDDPAVTPSQLLYFDIETTGLSPKDSYIYLIGCMYLTPEGPVLSQFLSEGIEDEPCIINAFKEILQEHPVPADYNGTTFDIPFLKARADALGIDLCFGPLQLDIYRILKVYKDFFPIRSLRLKSIEQFMGIRRMDQFDGDELIDVYIRYVSIKKLDKIRNTVTTSGNTDGIVVHGPRFSDYTGLRLIGDSSASDLEQALLLHNFEDVKNLPDIARLLVIHTFMHGDFSISSCNADEHSLHFSLLPNDPLFGDVTGTLPVRLHFASKDITCVTDRASGLINLSVPVVDCELKLFFPDYRNYYYLVNEDYAIHKSIGEFMDRSVCVRCNQANCYTRKTGRFVPVFAKKGAELAGKLYLYRRSITDKLLYAAAEDIINTPGADRLYLTDLFRL